MNWLILILAAFFEIGWPVGFKMSSLHPEKFGLYIALGSLSMLLSGEIFLNVFQFNHHFHPQIPEIIEKRRFPPRNRVEKRLCFSIL